MKRVYLDNAATTPIAQEVIEAMIPVMQENFGNPSSTHTFGRQSKALLENSRRSIAKHLNCKPSEIIFTSGGTEADNMAINSCVSKMGVTRIITTPLEHHAVGHTCSAQEANNGVEVVFVDTDCKGNVDLTHLETLLSTSDKKTLVSLMHANNEIATLLPLAQVSQICRRHNALFHSDTVQTMGHYTFDLEVLDIDFITCAAHKFHGPKGVGFLYVKQNIKIDNLIQGGSQERGHRGGTENLYGIVGLAKAMDLAYEDIEGHQKEIQALKSYMMDRLQNELKDVNYHGETQADKSLYTVLNVQLPATSKAGMLLFTLDLQGVAASGGSACTSGAAMGSHVLDGIQADMSRPNVRFSFSRYTTKEEIDFAVDALLSIYSKLLV